MLNGEGCRINRKGVQRLMRKMGIAALGPKPKTTKPVPEHKIFPYLLRHMVIDRPNQMCAADIIYVPIGQGFLYLVAIIDWASRAVLAWRLSNTMDTSYCVSALEGAALARFGRPEIFNTDQGSQFTSVAFTGTLAATGVRISMDGRGRWMDNVFIQRLCAPSNTRTSISRIIATRQSRNRPMDRILQFPAPSSGAGRPRADGGLAGQCKRRIRRRGCGYDASRKREAWTTLRVAHISTATTAGTLPQNLILQRYKLHRASSSRLIASCRIGTLISATTP
ncbi:Putative transposase [Bradyrhizobium vignae]|uniref:Transposase n=2 Tax=Bradyrhizobium vignae TaxID=1549949 RepID=A0A2U3QA11_9BRAD|nr:Putative transposase [Bradyrhizobium vignae]